MNNSISVESIQIFKKSLLHADPLTYIALKFRPDVWNDLYIYAGYSEYLYTMTPLEGFTFILLILESENSENS